MAMLELVNCLSLAECQETVNKINSSESLWIHRQVDLDMPFYSLGAASYLDISQEPEDALKNGFNSVAYEKYNKLIKTYNPFLLEKFSNLYEKLIKLFSSKFNCEVKLLESLALPGFHIYLADWFFQDEMGIIHCDLQYMSHNWDNLFPNWKNTRDDLEKHLSFTLALELPKYGGGLYHWDYVYADVAHMDFSEREEYLSSKEKKYTKYSPGQLAIHSGDMYHQIAPMQEVQNEDRRITLQGHAALINDTYYLYW